MRSAGVLEETRHGPVKSIPTPVLLEIHRPDERVITYPKRNANPFFHCLEFAWMMAGTQDVEWIAQFNSRMTEFADDGKINGAYGYRWLDHWGDQVAKVINCLIQDPQSRQAVIAMWDPSQDLYPAQWNDRPCNTHIYFRVQNGMLNMTVCNRSNDMMWGMFGANVVHMTMLHELIAHFTGLKLGVYRVFTHNLHVYLKLDGYPSCLDATDADEHDIYNLACSFPLIKPGETYAAFREDARRLVHGEINKLETRWFNEVAAPMYLGYMQRKQKLGDGGVFINRIRAEDWRIACQLWTARKSRQSGQEIESEGFTRFL